jgi:hypothetical protein
MSQGQSLFLRLTTQQLLVDTSEIKCYVNTFLKMRAAVVVVIIRLSSSCALIPFITLIYLDDGDHSYLAVVKRVNKLT